MVEFISVFLISKNYLTVCSIATTITNMRCPRLAPGMAHTTEERKKRSYLFLFTLLCANANP